MPAQVAMRHFFPFQRLDGSNQFASVHFFPPILAAADPKRSDAISRAPMFGLVAQ